MYFCIVQMQLILYYKKKAFSENFFVSQYATAQYTKWSCTKGVLWWRFWLFLDKQKAALWISYDS